MDSKIREVDDSSFFDCLRSFYFLLIEIHRTFFILPVALTLFIITVFES